MAVIEELFIGLGYKTDTKALDEARKKAKRAAASAEKAFKEASKEVEKAQDAVANAADKASKRQAQAALRAARKTARAAKESMQAAKQASKEAQAQAKKSADAAVARAAKFRNAWTGAAKKAGLALAAFGTAAGVGLAKLVLDSAEAADSIAKTSKQIGVSSNELQRLQFAGQRSGASLDDVNRGAKDLNKNLLEATTKGTGPAADAMKILGLEAEQFIGLGIEEKFGLVADSLNQVEDAQTRAALAGKFFGEESGVKLSALLDEGADGIRGLGDEAERYGAVLDEKTLKAAEDFEDSLLNLKSQAKGAGFTIAGVLIPQVDDAAQAMSSWISENQEFIKQDIPDLMESIGRVASITAGAIQKVASAYASVTREAADFGAAMGDLLAGKALEVQLGWSVLTGEISIEAANAVRAGLDRASVSRGAPSLAPPPKESDVDGVDRLLAATRSGEISRGFGGRRVRVRPGSLKTSGGGKSKDQKKAEAELAEALIDVKTLGIEDDLRALGARVGASDKAIEAARKSAAESLIKGASRKVAAKAGRGVIGQLTGVDVEKKQTDPLLSSIFGDDTLPDVPLSELERGQQPQVLISTINNTYNVEVNNRIDGAQDPTRVAENVEDRFRRVLSSEVAATSKMSKVVFAR